MKQAEVAPRRREIRTTWRIAAGSLVALVVSTGLGLMAWKQTQQEGLFGSVNLSPDGKTLGSGSGSGNIKRWNVERGKESRTRQGHDSPVGSVNFSPDGKTLVGGSDDGTSKLWNVETEWDVDALMGGSCDWIRGYLANPNSGVKEEDRHLCDGIGTKN